MPSPTRLLVSLCLLPLVVACGGGDSSPTGPSSTQSTPTRIINVNGNLAFGDVAVGSQRDLNFVISNTGNSPLTITGMTVSGGLASHLTASFTTGAIAAGGTQTVNVRFQPTVAGNYSGTVTVNGDHTSGANSIPISANATGPTFQGTWSGRYVVERCDGTGSAQDYFCSNNRGFYPPGTNLPISISLTQNGTSVAGTVSFGQVTGVMNGSVTGGGTLVLQGNATSGTLSLSLSSWNTTASGNSMSGSFTYNASFGGIPGVAVVVSRLSGVTKR